MYYLEPDVREQLGTVCTSVRVCVCVCVCPCACVRESSQLQPLGFLCAVYLCYAEYNLLHLAVAGPLCVVCVVCGVCVYLRVLAGIIIIRWHALFYHGLRKVLDWTGPLLVD